MANVMISLPFEYALAYQIKRKLLDYGVVFVEQKHFHEMKLTCQYIFDECYVPIIELNECLQGKELSQWEIQHV